MTHWQLQDAKNKLSQVVNMATHEGPQSITLRGKETAVILSIDDYRKLTRTQGRLSEFFRQSPLAGVSLDHERPADTGRDITL
jgi:prevent-host-death family protein